MPNEEPSAAENSAEHSEVDAWLQTDVQRDDDIEQLEDFSDVDVLQDATSEVDNALQLNDSVQLDDAVSQVDNALQFNDSVQLDDDNVQFYNCAQVEDGPLDDPVQFDGHMQLDDNMAFEDQEESNEGLEDSDEENDSEPQYDHDDPLYPGAEITVGVFMTLLLAFAVRHKLTNEALSDLLYLMDHICPKPNRCCKTLYKFKKFFSFLVLPFKCCYYCSQCVNPISVNPITFATVTACSVCNTAINSVKDLSYFIHISISDQIRSLFVQKTFYDNLLHRFTRVKANQGGYEDIYDGSLYKDLMSPNGILSSQNNISLTWNIDGLPVFSSSKFSLWPCYLVVNELPYRLRLLKENIIIGGLWFGEEKPNMHVYLKPIIGELAMLEQHGIEVQSPSVPHPFVSKAVLLAGTCDLPAKCLILNTIQFNGMFGCSKCLQPGLSFPTSARGSVHVYPFSSEDPCGPARSRIQNDLDARQAVAEKSVINGVKGPSWLRKLETYDIIDGTAIDYMHCVLLGVMRLLLSLWISSEHHNEHYYIGRQVKLIDSRLETINPPSIITRKPRKLSIHFKYYKASEYRAFLLYYSLPVLSGILPSQYWNHYSLLVVSIHTLLQQSISDRQLNQCQYLINTFCQQFEVLYSQRYMSANVHLLLHLPNTVRQLGPLWVFSCFYFEGQNGMLKRLVHGTQHIDKQIIKSFSHFKNLSVTVDKFFSEHPSSHLDAFKHLDSSYRHKVSPNSLCIGSNLYALGKPSIGSIDKLLKNSEVQALQQVIYGPRQVKVYSRVKFHNIMLHSTQWNNKGVLKQNNATVAYRRSDHVEYGIIKKFVVISDNEIPTQTIVIICTLDHTQLQQSGTVVPHIFVCSPPSESSEVVAVSIKNIISPCIFMAFSDVPNSVYVAAFANLLEKD